MSEFWESVGALLPPAGVALLFIVVIRAMIHADRRERIARANEDAADRDGTTDGAHGSNQ